MTLGADADVIGDVTAVATVALGAVSKITGDVIAGTTITTAAGAMDGPSSVPPPPWPMSARAGLAITIDPGGPPSFIKVLSFSASLLCGDAFAKSAMEFVQHLLRYCVIALRVAVFISVRYLTDPATSTDTPLMRIILLSRWS